MTTATVHKRLRPQAQEKDLQNFQAAARRIAELVSKEQLDQGILFPRFGQLRDVSVEVAVTVAEVAYSERWATAEPPRGMLLREFVKRNMWHPEYVPVVTRSNRQ